jgi:flagellar basal body-associated protein FliL
MFVQRFHENETTQFSYHLQVDEVLEDEVDFRESNQHDDQEVEYKLSILKDRQGYLSNFF